MATRLDDLYDWSLERDDDGYRTYKIKFEVESDEDDGPAMVLQTAGLPIPGNAWRIKNDVDVFVWFRPTASVQPYQKSGGARHKWWTVEMTASNKPPENPRCHDQQIEDPLLEPQKVSGSTIKYTEEASYDRFGEAITYSSHEQIRGPQVEFDGNRHKVRVQQNWPLLQVDLWAPMIDTVNDAPFWGLPKRCWKLSDVNWEERYHGQCYKYFVRTFEFDSHAIKDPDTGLIISGHDRDILDEGTKVLRGYWTPNGKWALLPIGGTRRNPNQPPSQGNIVGGRMPDKDNPLDFDRFKDKNGENTSVILNGEGLPAGVVVDTDTGTGTGTIGGAVTEVGTIHVEKYDESNFLLLGVPAVIGP